MVVVVECRLVHTLYVQGDYQGAYEASMRARVFAVIAIAIGTLLILLALFSSSSK